MNLLIFLLLIFSWNNVFQDSYQYVHFNYVLYGTKEKKTRPQGERIKVASLLALLLIVSFQTL